MARRRIGTGSRREGTRKYAPLLSRVRRYALPSTAPNEPGRCIPLDGLDLAERLVERHLLEHLGDHVLEPLALLVEGLGDGLFQRLLQGVVVGEGRHGTGGRGERERKLRKSKQ